MKKNIILTILITLVLLLQSGTLYSSPNKNFTDLTIGMEFVFVEGGCYQMGDSFGNKYVDELPLHEVCLDDFYIAKYEVTQGEYQKIIEENPSSFRKGENYPTEGIS